METLRTGQLARLAGVTIETLRFYERRGLLPRPPRSASGYRAYPARMLRVVRFIRRAQRLGFSLREINELLALSEAPGARCSSLLRVTEQKLAEIERKIDDLRAIGGALRRLIRRCPGTAPLASCPILGCLSDPCAGKLIDSPRKRKGGLR